MSPSEGQGSPPRLTARSRALRLPQDPEGLLLQQGWGREGGRADPAPFLVPRPSLETEPAPAELALTSGFVLLGNEPGCSSACLPGHKSVKPGMRSREWASCCSTKGTEDRKHWGLASCSGP